MQYFSHIPLKDLNVELSNAPLKTTGTFPGWLSGVLIRNGPAKFHFDDQEIDHWFDGLAMLHAFTFDKGEVSYVNKFLRSTPFYNAQKGDLRFLGFMQDPKRSLLQRILIHYLPWLTPHFLQNCNVNVLRIANEYVAVTETPLPVRFDPKTLETHGALNFQDSLCKLDCFECAHPQFDAKRNQFVNYQAVLGLRSHYRLYTIDNAKPIRRKAFTSIPVDKISYMHSFALTPRYMILAEFPLLLEPLDHLLKGGGYLSNFKWHPERNTRFHVIERATGKRVRILESEAFFCFHHVNAFEEQDRIQIDLIAYPDPTVVYRAPLQEQKRFLLRFELDLQKNSLEKTVLAETHLEFPRINEKYHMHSYRYVYGVGFHSEELITLQKIDTHNGNRIEWKMDGSLAGEPIFVSSPQSIVEDEGILLSVVSDYSKNHSFLLALDAKNFEEIARAEIPHCIPYGLHGQYFVF